MRGPTSSSSNAPRYPAAPKVREDPRQGDVTVARDGSIGRAQAAHDEVAELHVCDHVVRPRDRATEVAFGEARVDLHAQADPRASGEVDAVDERRAEAQIEAQWPGVLDRDHDTGRGCGAGHRRERIREPRRGVVPLDPERRSGGEHEASPELGCRVHRATEALLLRSPRRLAREVPPAELDDVADAHARRADSLDRTIEARLLELPEGEADVVDAGLLPERQVLVERPAPARHRADRQTRVHRVRVGA